MQIARKKTFLEKNDNTPVLSGSTFLLCIRDNFLRKEIGSLIMDSTSSSITINWGDGVIDTYYENVSNITHYYAKSGMYILNISDDVSSIKMQKSTFQYNTVITMSIGSKITTLQGNCFQNEFIEINPARSEYSGITEEQQFQLVEKYTKGKEIVLNATSIGIYSCFVFANTVRFTCLNSYQGIYSYSGGFKPIQNLIFDSPNISIAGDYLYDWSTFMQGWQNYYNTKTLKFSSKTLNQIKQMSGYPWRAPESPINIYFIGSDGIMDKNGNVVNSIIM